jgi:hypothetical protein
MASVVLGIEIILLIIGVLFAGSWIVTGMRLTWTFFISAFLYISALSLFSLQAYRGAIITGLYFLVFSLLYIYDMIIQNDTLRKR